MRACTRMTNKDFLYPFVLFFTGSTKHTHIGLHVHTDTIIMADYLVIKDQLFIHVGIHILTHIITL